MAAGLGDRLLQPVGEQGPIGYAGEHVIVGNAVELALLCLDRTDIGQDGNVVADLTVSATDGGDRQNWA